MIRKKKAPPTDYKIGNQRKRGCPLQINNRRKNCRKVSVKT